MARATNRTFLYTHLMRWEPLVVEGATGRAWIKTLAKDDENGARTCLIKYDPEFRAPKAAAEWPADTFVLEGSMTCGDRQYKKGTFHYRPPGSTIGPIESSEGITRLIFTADDKTDSPMDEVFIQDVNTIPWGPSYSNIDPEGINGGTRLLREDPDRRTTIIIHTFFIPERSLVHQGHRHDHTEEAFTLEGEMEDYCGDVEGHMAWVPGTYICRPPNGSIHGDTNKQRIPVSNIIRRGWVGNTETFHSDEHNAINPVPRAVTWAE